MDRLEKSFQAEKQFTSDMSHELRTPVSVILSQCELSLEEEQDQQAYQDALHVIKRQGQKMSAMINDMLTMTRMEQRTDRIVMKELDFSLLCDTVCQDLCLLHEKGIQLEYRLTKGIVVWGMKSCCAVCL